MSLDELEKKAREAEHYCNKCGYFGPTTMHMRPSGGECDYLAAQSMRANPSTILDLIARCRKAEEAIEVLEAMRPHWAKGYSSDSVAAQVSHAALSDIWKLLGVDNQTQAMLRLEELRKAEDRVAELESQNGGAVAEAGSMPGTDGFTMACFKADAVPLGTKLYLRAPQAVPEGWKLVPIEPTDEMEQRGGEATHGIEWSDAPDDAPYELAIGIYRTMIAAAPSPEGEKNA